MNQTLEKTKNIQLKKKRLLEREVAWLEKEFKDFNTLSDIELYNTERYARLHLGAIC